MLLNVQKTLDRLKEDVSNKEKNKDELKKNKRMRKINYTTRR